MTKFGEALFILAFTATVFFSSTGMRPGVSRSPGKPGLKTSSAINAISSSGSANVDAGFRNLYKTLRLDSQGLDSATFELALKGWDKLKATNLLSNESLLSIADFSQPSTKKRLYIIDMKNSKLLFNTYVAHGRNSGKEQATDFSNNPSSNKSSPGFYRTEKTYYGNNGYSLRLEGLEKGINDNAESRAIVMHGADYVNESRIRNSGYLGRSQGCPAIPLKLTRPIINTIKNGSCLFIYAPATYYAEHSRLIR